MGHFAKRGAISSVARAINLLALEQEQQGKSVIRLHIGAPSTGAPKAAMDRLEQAAKDDILGYSAATGLPILKKAISQHYKDQYDASVDPERVIVTVGASGAMILALLSWFDVGEKIGLPYPVYGAYKNTIELLDLQVVPIPTSFANRFLPTIEDIESLDESIDGLILVSPSNPAGSAMRADELKSMLDYCETKGIRVISDEIYHGITFSDIELPTSQSYSDQVISINSFSKYYSMPGWRIGWMVVPEALIDNIGCVMRNMLIAPPTPSQYAALGALEAREELDQHVERYRLNRDLMVDGLTKAGFDRFIVPEAAFYFYAHVEHLTEDAMDFCKKMIQDIQVTASPGTDFDPYHGRHYLRFSYAGSTESIKEAVARIDAWRHATK